MILDIDNHCTFIKILAMIKRTFLSNLIIIFILLLFLTDCKNKTKTVTARNDASQKILAKELGIPGTFSSQTEIKFDSININSFLDSFPRFKIFKQQLLNFYKNRNYAYAWYDENGIIEPASNLYNRIQNISDEGLPDSLPYKVAFTNLIIDYEGNKSPSPTTELMLTSQYIAYAKNVWQGLSEKQSLSTEWLLPRKKITTQQLLDSLINGTGKFKSLPMYRQYNLLKDYLKKYNGIKNPSALLAIKGNKKLYKLLDSAAVIADIRERLFLLEDIATNNHSMVFDSLLAAGVKQFERRLGYKEDGIINATLLAEMNFPIKKRIEQILVNMERSRWVPVELKSDYLLVNIPEYKLHVYQQDSLLFSMNAVVGKNQNKTVIFNGDMKYIVFSPYWNIPSSILNKEVLPGIKKNSNYLTQHNMDWNGGNVRQKPGANNSLGLVKFLFPNTHSIYLHDSPAKSLFFENARAFSHGCIRLAEPKKLAEYLLRNDSNWNNEKITSAMNGRSERYVTLKKTVPVFIAYFTAWVDRQGKLNFRNDVYKRDERLAKMILDNPGI